MRRHLIGDVHEWINDAATVPTAYFTKSLPGERAWKRNRGKKTLLSLALVFCVEGPQWCSIGRRAIDLEILPH